VLSRNVVDPKSKCKSNRNLKKITVSTHSLSIIPSTAFGQSDRKKRALTCRHNFVTSILYVSFVNSQQIWVTVTAFCDFFRRLFVTSLEGFL
jgi:hypothetical protein